MEVKEAADRLLAAHKSDLYHISILVLDARGVLGEMEENRWLSPVEYQITHLPDEEREQVETELDLVEEAMRSGNYEVPSDFPYEETHPMTTRYVKAWFIDARLEDRLGFLQEMALVYAIALTEAFTKEYLQLIYVNKPEVIKSRRQVTFEEVLSYGSIEELRRALAEKEVVDISYRSVDDLAEYLNYKFNLGIGDGLDWRQMFREAHYRRNILVHNRGIVNDLYASKVVDAPSLGTSLGVSEWYLDRVLEALSSFATFLHESLADKFELGA